MRVFSSVKYPALIYCGLALLLSCRSSGKKSDGGVRGSQASYTLTAVGLSEAYAADPVAADAKYKDRVIFVTGSVDHVETDLTGGYTVSLRCGSEWYDVLTCKFSKTQEAALQRLTTGSYVRVKGRCSGRSPVLTIGECVLVDEKGSPLGG